VEWGDCADQDTITPPGFALSAMKSLRAKYWMNMDGAAFFAEWPAERLRTGGTADSSMTCLCALPDFVNPTCFGLPTLQIDAQMCAAPECCQRRADDEDYRNHLTNLSGAAANRTRIFLGVGWNGDRAIAFWPATSMGCFSSVAPGGCW